MFSLGYTSINKCCNMRCWNSQPSVKKILKKTPQDIGEQFDLGHDNGRVIQSDIWGKVWIPIFVAGFLKSTLLSTLNLKLWIHFLSQFCQRIHAKQVFYFPKTNLPPLGASTPIKHHLFFLRPPCTPHLTPQEWTRLMWGVRELWGPSQVLRKAMGGAESIFAEANKKTNGGWREW